MLNYVGKLRDCDFVDLLVAIKKMKYGDIKNCEYIDKDTYRNVRLLDCSPFTENREAEQYFTVDDYNISDENALFDYYLFMLNQFGDEWHENAKQHLKEDNVKLRILEKAKNSYEADLEADEEFFETLN